MLSAISSSFMHKHDMHRHPTNTISASEKGVTSFFFPLCLFVFTPDCMAVLFDSWVSRERCLGVFLSLYRWRSFVWLSKKMGVCQCLVTKKGDGYKESTLYLYVVLFSWLRKQTSHLVAKKAFGSGFFSGTVFFLLIWFRATPKECLVNNFSW